MLAVSQRWKDLQEQGFIDRPALLTITFKVVDSSQYDTVVDLVDATVYCTPHDIVGQDYTIVRYATLERNFWLLDGSREILPDFNRKPNTGYISNNLNGTTTITITNFDHLNTIGQFSINFGEFNCAKDFSVIWKRDGNIVFQVDITNNRETNFTHSLGQDVSGYDEVDIIVSSVAIPDQRLRIETITMGIIKVYTNRDIVSFKMNSSVSILNDSLPTNEIDFELDNTDNMFNPDYANGLFNYLSKRQEIKVQFGYDFGDDDTEFINGGTYYLTEWDTPQNGLTATFKAKNIIHFFNKMFLKGINETQSLSSLAEQVRQVMGWDADYFYVDPSLDEIFTDAPMPSCTCAEALQYIAQASNCALFVDRNNVINIRPIDTETIHSDYYISNFKEYEYPELEIDDEISFFNIGIYSYFRDEEISELFKGELSIGTQDLILSDMADYNDITVSGAEFVDTSSFLTTCEVETQGEVIVSGYELKESSSIYTVDNDKNGDELDIDNPLITSEERAIAVVEYIQDWANKRNNDSVSFRIDPRLELLDIVPVQGKLARHNDIVKSISLTYNGAYKGSCVAKRID